MKDFDTANRLGSVFECTNSATYSYIANSPMVSQTRFTNGNALRMIRTNQYDFLNRLTYTASLDPSQNPISSFTYSLNSTNQCTGVTNADSSYWANSYDALDRSFQAKSTAVLACPPWGSNSYTSKCVCTRKGRLPL